MAISIQAGASATNSAANITPPLPASVNAGDLLIATLVCRDPTTPSLMPPAPSGWALFYFDDNSADWATRVYTRTAGASETAPTFTYGATISSVACIVRARDTTTPVVRNLVPRVHAGSTSSIDPAATGATKIGVVSANPTVVGPFNTTWSGGETEQVDAANGTAAYLTIASKAEDTAGALTFTLTITPTPQAIVFSLEPPDAAKPTPAQIVGKVPGTEPSPGTARVDVTGIAATGRLLLILGSVDRTTVGAGTEDMTVAESGWTRNVQRRSTDTGVNETAAVWTKVSDGSETTVNITATYSGGAATMRVSCCAVAIQDAGGGFDGYSGADTGAAGTGVAFTSPTFTATQENELVLALTGYNAASTGRFTATQGASIVQTAIGTIAFTAIVLAGYAVPSGTVLGATGVQLAGPVGGGTWLTVGIKGTAPPSVGFSQVTLV